MRLLSGLALVGVLCGLGAPGVSWARGGPVVVELFTAQGCASCKQANRLVAKLADRPGVIALTWPVDYWDYLGWKDTFASPEFTARQRAYARHVGPRDVYTPQVVVNGAGQVSGDDAKAVEALALAAEATLRPRLVLRLTSAGRAALSRAPRSRGDIPAGADVWLVRFDPKEEDVEVKAGDNRGATVVHRNVVRQVSRLGAWRRHGAIYRLPAAPQAGLSTVVLVQGAHGGPIFAAAQSRSAGDR